MDDVLYAPDVQLESLAPEKTYARVRAKRTRISSIRLASPVNALASIDRVFRECNARLPMGGTIHGRFIILQRKGTLTGGAGFAVLRRLHGLAVRRLLACARFVEISGHRFVGSMQRPMSTCELYGRLSYCGFQVRSFSQRDGIGYFTAVKVDEPMSVPVKHGLLLGLPRMGTKGRIFTIYKLRTMYPYAQFLHDYLIETNGFDRNGKIKNDFRIPRWGRLLRRFWLDEIPQIFNLLKGDMRLVGIRPISLPIYQCYPPDLRQARALRKPGLIPPFYADLPESMEQVWASERRYIENHNRSPLRTDLRCLAKALYNIILKGVRSC